MGVRIGDSVDNVVTRGEHAHDIVHCDRLGVLVKNMHIIVALLVEAIDDILKLK